MSHTFQLGLALNGPALDTELVPDKWCKTPAQQFQSMLSSDLEQACDYEARIISAPAHLVGLAHSAFASHLHMILDPDSVWMTIERGFAIHITENAEELREQFVNFRGKQFIEIQRDHFVKGEKNDWEGCFDEFSEKIGEFIGKKRDLIVSDYSTTGTLQRVSSEIILMDAMSKYFDYGVSTCCSIPLVTLEGTVEDWQMIRDRVAVIAEFGLSWWTDHLIPVCDQLVKAAKGQPDLEFWQSWYKEGGGSGGPYISGHITKFFPYLQSGSSFKKSEVDYTGRGGMFGRAPTLDNFPKGISKVPFVWDYYGAKMPMEFAGGVIGIQQQDDGAIRCAHGWAVREKSVPLSNYPLEYMVKDMIITHKDGDVGKLKRAEVEQWGDGSRELSDLEIEWERKGIQKHKRWDISEMYVKETSNGEVKFYNPEQKESKE